METRPINQPDDIFSTEVPHAYANDTKPENPLLDRSSYNYELPEDRIAQVPLEDRSASKMLVLDRSTGEVDDKKFINLPDFLKTGDVLVVNNTKVIPARIFAQTSANVPIELLLVRPEGDTWKVMINSDVGEQDVLYFMDGDTCWGTADVIRFNDDNSVQIKFNEGVWELLEHVGHTPLPPYIHNQSELEEEGIAERYNTVYSKGMTSVAAPTAGLHFTETVLNQLKEKGVHILEVRLDVGLGTFRPVVVNDIRNHHMHTEHIVVSKDVIAEINTAKSRGNRVIAVGTTALRTLESIPNEVWENPTDYESDTSIFIYPGCGHEVRTVDGLFTNFHAPESTLMMLVSVVAGYDNIMKAYKHAVEANYRFLSFGDCMLII